MERQGGGGGGAQIKGIENSLASPHPGSRRRCPLKRPAVHRVVHATARASRAARARARAWSTRRRSRAPRRAAGRPRGGPRTAPRRWRGRGPGDVPGGVARRGPGVDEPDPQEIASSGKRSGERTCCIPDVKIRTSHRKTVTGIEYPAREVELAELAASKTLASIVPDGWARGEREGYGEPAT